jgi:DNA-binding XRE family transcriptional regulator
MYLFQINICGKSRRMKSIRYVAESELAKIAKEARENAGKTRAEAARDMGIKQPSIFHAEESPEQSFTKLRCRMIEAYSDFKVSGPLFKLEPKR